MFGGKFVYIIVSNSTKKRKLKNAIYFNLGQKNPVAFQWYQNEINN